MKILYFNNCWFTNVGEAFIDIGAIEIIRRIFPDAKIACISEMSRYYCDKVMERSRFNFLQKEINGSPVAMEKYIDGDYIILAGMFASVDWLQTRTGKLLENFVDGGGKVIFLGLGGNKYTEEERKVFSEYLIKIKPTLVVTRDNKTYDNYKNVANSIKGIDCAFWVNDVYNPQGFTNTLYDVVTFNRTEIPKEVEQIVNRESTIVPWHMQYFFNKSKIRNNTLISDTPYDYLTVYANAKKVYTDLVHASIISLMYNVPVKYWYVDERSNAFYALEKLHVDTDGFMTILPKDLAEQKENIITNIRKCFDK